jgi:hypothetical protein
MSLLAAEGYCAVQGIRFGADVLERVAEVRAFMRRHDVRIGSWWLCERSTPGDVEAQLSDAGLVQVPGDYEIAGMLLTREPPLGPPGRTPGCDPRWRRNGRARSRPRGLSRARPRTLGRRRRARRRRARRPGRLAVGADPAAARLRARAAVPSPRGRPARRVPFARMTAVKEICLRCGAEMEWRHGTWQCAKCRFKLGCCEGEAGDCRDPG